MCSVARKKSYKNINNKMFYNTYFKTWVYFVSKDSSRLLLDLCVGSILQMICIAGFIILWTCFLNYFNTLSCALNVSKNSIFGIFLNTKISISFKHVLKFSCMRLYYSIISKIIYILFMSLSVNEIKS